MGFLGVKYFLQHLLGNILLLDLLLPNLGPGFKVTNLSVGFNDILKRCSVFFFFILTVDACVWIENVGGGGCGGGVCKLPESGRMKLRILIGRRRVGGRKRVVG